MVGIFAGGSISGGVFNPAVAVATCLMGLTAWSSIWIYLVANCAGGVLAAVVFNLVKSDED
jgi:aquaporin Z